MDTKKFLISTITGGIVYFLLGFLVYALLLDSFFESHSGTATGVEKTIEMQYWPLFVGNLAQAALLSYVFIKWAHIKTFSAGFSAGFIIGFLMTLGHYLIQYDTTNIMDLTGTIAEVAVYSIMTAIVGGVVGAVIGMGSK
ncbi:MAG: hypothetical protein ABI663_13835 [Chryseolinea sp.]